MVDLAGVCFDDDLPSEQLEAVFNNDHFSSSILQLPTRSRPGLLTTTSPSSSRLGKLPRASLARPCSKRSKRTFRVIFHIDVDSFYVSAERSRDSKLVGHPVAVKQHNQGGFVAISYEARAAGIRKGDAVGEQGRRNIRFLKHAKSLETCVQMCPELVVLPMDTVYYRDVSERLQACMQRCLGPQAVVEKSSIDDFYVDMSAYDREAIDPSGPGADSQTINCIDADQSLKKRALITESVSTSAVDPPWMHAYSLAHTLRKTVAAEFGGHFTLSVGISNSKLISRLISGCHKPSGQTVCLPETCAVVAQVIPLKVVPSLRHKQGDELVALIREQSTACDDGIQVDGGSDVDIQKRIDTDMNSASLSDEEQELRSDGKVGSDRRLPLETLSTIQSIPKARLAKLVGGERAQQLYQWAEGVDRADVVARSIPDSIISERSFPPSDWSTVAKWAHELSNELLARIWNMYKSHSRVATRMVVRWRLGYDAHGGVGGIHSMSIPLPSELRQSLAKSAVTKDVIMTCQKHLGQHVVTQLKTKLERERNELLRSGHRTGITADRFPGMTRLQLGVEGFEQRAKRGLQSYFKQT
eukprot:TRINITY_DN11175_c0_g1_i2.p1 TRINITY_DN11175_c0_g1~~TRINITY_DN11175_c0_g1_i2.p1  ORF type:complete len:585 (+),score=84.32 TRINITY_DN11175_c0_g1_i2:1220-2974(+)